MTPITTSATPKAAPSATRMAIVGNASPDGLRPRELPLGVDLARTYAARGQDRLARRIRAIGRRAVVLGRLELVFQDGVVEKPVEVLRVARGHEDREARAHLRRTLTLRDRPDADDDDVVEDGPDRQ